MSATVDRPVAPAAPGTFARAEGLELLGEFSGSGYKDGVALVRRADGQMVQLGPLMYGLLEEIDGERDHEALAAATTERLGRRLDTEHVAALGEKLAGHGLLAGSEDNAPPRLNPLLALRLKVLVTDPKVTNRITAPFQILFRPWALVPMLAGFAVVFWFVLLHKGVASATAQAFDSPELLLLVFGLAVASGAVHEIGHAAACRYGGGRPGGIGAGIYMVWPAFYTDVTDAYRLPRGARLRTDLGGIYFNAVIAVVTLAVWVAVPDRLGQAPDALDERGLAERGVAEDEPGASVAGDPVGRQAVDRDAALGGGLHHRRLVEVVGQVGDEMQPRGDAGGLELRDLLAQGAEEGVAPAAVDRAHPPHVAVELASGQEVGEGELVERGRAPVGQHLRLRDRVHEAGRRHEPAEPQPRRQRLARGARVDRRGRGRGPAWLRSARGRSGTRRRSRPRRSARPGPVPSAARPSGRRPTAPLPSATGATG